VKPHIRRPSQSGQATVFQHHRRRARSCAALIRLDRHQLILGARRGVVAVLAKQRWRVRRRLVTDVGTVHGADILLATDTLRSVCACVITLAQDSPSRHVLKSSIKACHSWKGSRSSPERDIPSPKRHPFPLAILRFRLPRLAYPSIPLAALRASPWNALSCSVTLLLA